jgi:hypothetical protein
LSEGEKYNTLGKWKLHLSTGQVNQSQITALKTIMTARDVSIYTSQKLVAGFTYFNDWVLPSKDEFQAMHDQLYLFGVGGFSALDLYMCSSEADLFEAYQLAMVDNIWYSSDKTDTNLAKRACRTFITSKVYALRDTGQGGGLIFHIVDNGNGTFKYWESALTDLDINQIWSNINTLLVGTGTAIGTGQANTTAIINQLGHTNSAAKLCNDLVVNVASTHDEGVWSTLKIEPGSLVVFNNTINGYEFEFNAIVGSLQVPLIVPEPPAAYITPPAFISAEVGNVASDMLVIRFNNLLQLVTPANGDFIPVFTGGAVSVTNVAITSVGGYYYVYLTLSRVIVFGEEGTIQYIPGVNKLIGVSPYNSDVFGFTEPVTNNVVDIAAPVWVSSKVDVGIWPDGDHITIEVNKDLNPLLIPPILNIGVNSFSGGAVNVTLIEIYDVGYGTIFIYLTLDRQIAAGETGGTVSYDGDWTPGDKLTGVNGVEMADFTENIYNRP